MSGDTIREESRSLHEIVMMAQMAPLVGAVLYGCGWVFFAGLAYSLGVTTEDLGVNFEFLLPRVALGVGLLSLLTIGPIVLVWNRTKVTTLRNKGYESAFGTFTLLVLIPILILIISAVFFIYYYIYHLSSSSSTIKIIQTVVALIVVIIVAIFSVYIVVIGVESNSKGSRVLAILIFLSVCVLVPLMATLWSLGASTGRTIQGGNSWNLGVVTFPRVSATPTLGKEDNCLILLGRNGSSYTILAHNGTTGAIHHVPVEKYRLIEVPETCDQ